MASDLELAGACMFTLTLQLGFWTQVLPLIVHHWDSQLLWLRVPHVLQAGLETCMASDLELAGACMFTLTLQLGFWTQVLPLIVHHWDSQLLWLRVPHVLQAGLETCMASEVVRLDACAPPLTTPWQRLPVL
jgi:uncharacterized membrane protein